MRSAAGSSRAATWLDGLGEWSWPGRAVAAAEPAPPSWVPAQPPLRPAYALAGAGAATPVARSRPLHLALGLLIALLATLCLALATGHAGPVEELLGRGPSGAPGAQPLAVPAAPPQQLPPVPVLHDLAADREGSTIAHAAYYSPSLGSTGSFYVYLPAGYASGSRRYPVLYLLHGRDGHAQAFLEIGIQAKLDRLIARREIPPLVVVMVQDRSGLNNWRDLGTRQSETYVVEVQELVDRMLRTIPTRSARAIAGSSMGGFGAMNVALSNPLRFAVVESWLGFFNNLEGALLADRGVISRLGLHAFLYGAAEDPVAVPSEDPEFAAELRAEGARADGVIYAGGHSLEKVAEHLDRGLMFAGRWLAPAARAGSR